MKPDWCDEATWERAARTQGYWGITGCQEAFARTIIAAKNEGLEEAAQVAENRDPHWPDDGDHIAAAIRSRIQTTQPPASEPAS